jgi:ubiquinol-cytochrome c reductase cytochrome b subunit
LFTKVRNWVSDRFGLGPIGKHFLYRRVPKTSWYYGDGSTLLLLLFVMIATGGLMALTYTPSIDHAYKSVAYITQEQPLGWFIRALHYWSAGLMVVMVLFHVFRHLLLGGYKFPREGTWLIMGFTGYLLRWDERAVYATTVVLHMFGRIPWIGDELVMFVQGGRELGALTLTRLYAVHVILVPLLLLGLAGYHLYLVVLHGVTSLAERRRPIRSVEEHRELYHRTAESETEGEVFHPETTAQSAAMAGTVFLLAIALALFSGPQALYPEANLVDPSMPEEEWWYWWYSALIALTPSAIAPALMLLFPLAVLFFLTALPFADRSPNRGLRGRPFMVTGTVAAILVLLYLSGLRFESPWTGWPRGEPPPVPSGVTLSPEAERGRQLFSQYGCNSCHAIAGQGPKVGPDLTAMQRRLSATKMRNFIERPPPGAAMPAYGQRLSPEQYDRLVSFLMAVQTFPREH